MSPLSNFVTFRWEMNARKTPSATPRFVTKISIELSWSSNTAPTPLTYSYRKFTHCSVAASAAPLATCCFFDLARTAKALEHFSYENPAVPVKKGFLRATDAD
jgi:hypothetical protein